MSVDHLRLRTIYVRLSWERDEFSLLCFLQEGCRTKNPVVAGPERERLHTAM